jgi:hypothetical protein
VDITVSTLDALGNDFEKTGKGFIDFLLLNERGFPLIVLEAKAEDKNPLVGKEQARKYAKSQNCRFVILSNGNLHYFWDVERGGRYVITSFPTPQSVARYQHVAPNPKRLVDEPVGNDYIALTQRPNYQADAAWTNEAERGGFIEASKLRFTHEIEDTTENSAGSGRASSVIPWAHRERRDGLCGGVSIVPMSYKRGSRILRRFRSYYLTVKEVRSTATIHSSA